VSLIATCVSSGFQCLGVCVCVCVCARARGQRFVCNSGVS
jgi:hypothetical protein